MRSHFKTIVLAMVVIGVAVAGSAVDKTYDVSTAAFVSSATSHGVDGMVTETWGFEAGEGFAPGFVGGQAGWTTFAASVVEGHIDTANPHSGTQHFRISLDPAAAAGSLIGGFSPDVTDPIVDASAVFVYVFIGATGGADYDVVAQAPSQGSLTVRVKFSWLGDILILDDVGAGLEYVDTGVDWLPGSYNLLEIYIDPVFNTINYDYAAAQIYSSVAGVFAGTVVEQVVLISDNYNAGENGDFDDLTIDRGAVPVELQSFDID